MFLRTTGFDTAVTLACFFTSGMVAGFVLAGEPKWLMTLGSLGIGAVLYLILAPALYRLLRKRPMHFPPCPHCGTRAGPWGIPGRSAPIDAEQMVCGGCGVGTWFLYGAATDADNRHPAAFKLRWPRPLGRWTRIR